jgi:hypothetical protein
MASIKQAKKESLKQIKILNQAYMVASQKLKEYAQKFVVLPPGKKEETQLNKLKLAKVETGQALIDANHAHVTTHGTYLISEEEMNETEEETNEDNKV